VLHVSEDENLDLAYYRTDETTYDQFDRGNYVELTGPDEEADTAPPVRYADQVTLIED
jgi:hypothetical protein